MHNVEKLLTKYQYYIFQSSAYETPEFKTFCTKLKNATQQDIKECFPNLEFSVWSKGHFDVRCRNVTKSPVLYRSARHLKDYFGVSNLYCMAWELLEKINEERYEFIK